MNKIWLIIIFLLFSAVRASACILSYPEDGHVGMPAGYNEISAQVTNTGMYLTPSISGSTYNTTNTFLSYYYLDQYSKNVYNPPTTCNSLVFRPTQDFADETNYFAQVVGSEGFSFTTDPYLFSAGETTFKTYPSPSHHKPVSAMCDTMSVKVWQEKTLGIRAQRYEFIYDANGNFIEERPLGAEIAVGNSSAFYSPDIGPSVAMNKSCQFVIGYMKDWNYRNLNYMDLWAKKYDKNGNLLTSTYINRSWPDYVIQHKSLYLMQYDVSSPSVGIDSSGAYVVNVVVPKCYLSCSGCTKVKNYACDNYVMAWRYSPDGSTVTNLGSNENIINNVWTPYGSTFYPVNKVPFMDSNYNTRNLSAGCYGEGSAYDCPYHSHVAMSDYGIIVSWVEGQGNFGSDGNTAYYDDLLVRLFRNDAAGTPITPEKPMHTKQGTKQFDHWSPMCSINDTGKAACVGVCKYCNGMQTNPTIEMTDVFGRFMNPDGSWRSGIEFVVPEKNNYEQYNPAVAINNDNEVLFSWLSYGTDCGGYGVYSKLFDWNTGSALVDQFRVNTFNGLIVDTEEDVNVAQSNYTWSFSIGTAGNSRGDFLVTYPYPNYLYLNPASKAGIPASYGQGYSIKSNLLLSMPSPDIKANGSDNNISVSKSTPVNIAIGLNPGGYFKGNADWWVIRILKGTPNIWYYLNSSKQWTTTPTPYYQGTLYNLSSLSVSNSTLSPGNYDFHFGVDLIKNGILDANPLFYDSISVNVY